MTRSRALPGKARKAPMPKELDPMKATLVTEAFSKQGWIFENKWDGIRTIAFIKNGKLTLRSRNNKEMTLRYPEMSDLPDRIDATDAILDGEIVVLNAGGRVDFHLLASRFGVTDPAEIERLRKSQKIVYFVFDLIYYSGHDLMQVPLLERKALLKSVMRPATWFKFTPHVTNGEAFFKKVERARGEGMIAKRAESTYQQRRSKDWLKIKTQMRQEVVIVGYSDPRGSREYFGALELGLYEDGVLRSIGQVGTGFSHQSLREIYQKMKPLASKTQTVAEDGKRRSDVHWIKPKLVGEVKFSEFTPDRNLRHPAFLGLRDDKKPKDCTFEIPKSTSAIAKKPAAHVPKTESKLKRLVKR
jgi:bifunctional non-homologous end joining protein LigD